MSSSIKFKIMRRYIAGALQNRREICVPCIPPHFQQLACSPKPRQIITVSKHRFKHTFVSTQLIFHCLEVCCIPCKRMIWLCCGGWHPCGGIPKLPTSTLSKGLFATPTLEICKCCKIYTTPTHEIRQRHLRQNNSLWSIGFCFRQDTTLLLCVIHPTSRVFVLYSPFKPRHCTYLKKHCKGSRLLWVSVCVCSRN